MATVNGTLLTAINSHRSLDTSIDALRAVVSSLADNDPFHSLLGLILSELDARSEVSFAAWIACTGSESVNGLVRPAGEDFCLSGDPSSSDQANAKMFSEDSAH
jgi:hypothetical protein